MQRHFQEDSDWNALKIIISIYRTAIFPLSSTSHPLLQKVPIYNITNNNPETNPKTSLEALEEIESDDDQETTIDNSSIHEHNLSTKPDKVKQTTPFESSLMSLSVKLKQLKPEHDQKKKQYRKLLPLNLTCKKKKEIYEETGIPNIMFVSKSGHSAIGKNLTSILSLAEYSLYQS